jgi:mannitol/fructose-specific phosphotransferase system IIA component (Ntr-type)
MIPGRAVARPFQGRLQVNLSEMIQEDVIKVPLEATTKWEAIEELVDVLIDAHELRLTDRTQVVEAVFARERSMSTGLEHGLAVPHGAVDCVSDIVASLGVSKAGVPFQSADGAPATVIALLVIPKGSFQRHVRTLAAIARLAGSPDLRSRIIEASAPAEVFQVIYEQEVAQIGEES